MNYPPKYNVPYEQIDNGALILLLLKDCSTWEELCGRYIYADPTQLSNTTTMSLLKKIFELRDLGLIEFDFEETTEGKKPTGKIKVTDLWSKIRVAFGGMSPREAALLSRRSNGMAVVPVFGRVRQADEKIDVFVLMPFNAMLERIYLNDIKKLFKELKLTIRRADEIFSPQPFMEKVWNGICGSEIVIADCTQRNPNVFYEIGIAHTVGKKVILITKSDEDIPSDIGNYEYIHYSDDQKDIAALIKKLKSYIKKHFGQI